jgi:hypothetical protein
VGGAVRHSALAAVDALSDIRHLTTHPIRPAWQEELGRPAVPKSSGDDEDVAARELDDADGHRPEDRASEKALAGTSDDDEIGIGGSRGLQDFVRWVAFPGDRANVDGAGDARPRGDLVGTRVMPIVRPPRAGVGRRASDWLPGRLDRLGEI